MHNNHTEYAEDYENCNIIKKNSHEGEANKENHEWSQQKAM